MSNPQAPNEHPIRPKSGGPTPAPAVGSADQPTIVSDLSPKGSAAMPMVARETQLTRLSSGKRASDQTMTTDLPVEGQPGASAEASAGSHHHQRWGDFDIGDLLGRGGMGSVYRGKQVSLDRPVAIKVLPKHLSENENFRARFLLEAKAVAQISSPHVIQVYYAGVEDGHHYFAMEYVEGVDLAKKLKDGYRPSARESLELILQATRGLVAAGELGIVHRDIKPGNMMVTKKGLLKLMDFGLVRLARSEDTGLTMAGTIMGTVSYFSPEQGRGERCDSRTDIYALGIVYYELLVGNLPFTGGDATSVIYQHIHVQPRPPKEIDPTISEDVQAVVLKCLQKDPAQRYQTAAELLTDLEALASGRHPATAFTDPGSLRHGGAVVKSGAFAAERRRSGLLVAVAALVLLALAGGWFVLYGKAMLAPAAPPVAQLPATPAPLAAREDPPATPGQPAVPAPGAPPAAAPAPAAPAPGAAAAGGAAALDRARAALAADDLAGAHVLIDQARREHAGDADWNALGKELERADGNHALALAKAALARGDLDTAGRETATAQGLLGDSPAAAALHAQLVERIGARKMQARQLEEAENLINDGNPGKAEELLAKLASELPGDASVENALRRARKMHEDQSAIEKAVNTQLEVADQALARKDLDGALIGYTAAKQFDPKSQRATAGIKAVDTLKGQVAVIRGQFEKALKARDLPGAQHELDALRALVPGSPTLVLAENDFSNSKLAEEVQAKAAAEKAMQLSGAASALSARIDDPAQGLPELEQAVKDFIAKAGADHPQHAFLEQKLEDRRQRAQVALVLGKLDAAVAQKDAGAIKALVADAEFAEALSALAAYPGLVFASHLDEFLRNGDHGTVKVSVRHALAVMPERTLSYLYDLHRGEQGWAITGAHLQSR
jgi:serine/threonine-protein kinase